MGITLLEMLFCVSISLNVSITKMLYIITFLFLVLVINVLPVMTINVSSKVQTTHIRIGLIVPNS